MKKLIAILVLAALGVVAAVVAVGVADAGTMTTHHPGVEAAARAGGSQRLMQDPKAMQVMHTLHADHRKDMQAWRDKYGADPSSLGAQQALTQLWREHRQEMLAAFERAGIRVPAGLCTRSKMMSSEVTRSGAGMMGNDGTDMMGAGDTGSQGVHEQHHSGQGSGMMDAGSGMMGGIY